MIKLANSIDALADLAKAHLPDPYLCSVLCLGSLYLSDNLCDIYLQYNSDSIPTAVFSKMGSHAVLYALRDDFDRDEINRFFGFIGINDLSCGKRHSISGFEQDFNGITMQYSGGNFCSEPLHLSSGCEIDNFPSPRNIYPILSCQNSPYIQTGDFDGWYVDMSHRMRHGYAKAITVNKDSMPIACAFTTAMYDRCAVIGGIAVLPQYQKMGYGRLAVDAICRQLDGYDILLISGPENVPFYKKCGFCVKEDV